MSNVTIHHGDALSVLRTLPEESVQPQGPGGTVLNPFFGAGTTALVCQQLGRDCIGIELNPAYIDIAKRRLGLLTIEDLCA